MTGLRSVFSLNFYFQNQSVFTAGTGQFYFEFTGFFSVLYDLHRFFYPFSKCQFNSRRQRTVFDRIFQILFSCRFF